MTRSSRPPRFSRFTTVAWAGAFALASIPTLAAGPQTPANAGLNLEAGVRSLKEAIDAPGFSGVVVLMRGSDTLFAEARGMADKAQMSPNALSTRFNIASVGKFLTAALFARAAADSGQELASIRPGAILKEQASAFSEGLTAVDLLAHRTSVQSLLEVRGGVDRVGTARSNRDFADLVIEAQSGPIQALRGELKYNNANFILLGEMAAGMSGRTYEESLRAVVLDPARVTTAAFSRDEQPGQTAPAIGYVTADFNEASEDIAAPATDYPRPYSSGLAGARASAAGGLFISAPDLARVGVALLAGHILPPARFEALCTTQIPVPVLIYGLGCSGVNHGPGLRRWGHNGGVPGAAAEFALYPDRGLSLVILSNHDRRAQPVLKAFEAAYFGKAAQLRPGMIIR